MEILSIVFQDGSRFRLSVTKLGCLGWLLAAGVVAALCAILCACPGQVTTYQAAPDSGSQGGNGAGGGALDGGGAEVTVEGEVPEPDCEGDAMCWPWGFCDAGYCQAVDGGVD